MSSELISHFDALIRRDPARRGLISSEEQFGPLCPGHLHAAAAHLAGHAKCVGIVTGFYIPRGDPPAAETDGPLGSLFLASAFAQSGIRAFVITDTLCAPAIRAAASMLDFPQANVLECPPDSNDWTTEFWTTSAGRGLSHLIALERVGPSHTLESLAAQSRTDEIPEQAFLQAVPQVTWNHSHNMRGENIDAHTAPLHRLFETCRSIRPEMKTIGIGDGGNEIGMGCIPWEELTRRLLGEHSARIPCRIATDWNIVAGTSNWGGYALAAATLLLRGQIEVLRPFTFDQQEKLLNHVIQHGPAVDGVTRLREPTVDGLPFLTYIQPWLGMRHLLGWDTP
ncbi:MAG: glutamate cyclase domain-containing protein [Planctomycetota bacterium]